MRTSEPFNHFVDDYLAYLHEVHPTGASLDGVHTHDDLLEDFSRDAIEQHTRALSGFSRRLQEISDADLTPVERVERPMVASNILARMGDLEQVRTWEKNPQVYADILASSLAGQVVFGHAPLPERASTRSCVRRRASYRRLARTSRIPRGFSSRSDSRRFGAR